MFKGFGKPKEPSLRDVCDYGLAYYEILKEEHAHEADTSKLLAKAVMKFARHANDKPEEKEITYGRIVTGHVIGWMANQLQREGRTDVSLYTLLEFIDNMTVEQLMLQSKILMNA